MTTLTIATSGSGVDFETLGAGLAHARTNKTEDFELIVRPGLYGDVHAERRYDVPGNVTIIGERDTTKPDKTKQPPRIDFGGRWPGAVLSSPP